MQLDIVATAVVVTVLALLWQDALLESGLKALQTVGWYQLSAPVRVLLILTIPFGVAILLTATCPRLRPHKKVSSARISHEEFEAQKTSYTQECLADLRNSQDYGKFRRAVESKRIRSAFEEDGSEDEGREGGDEE